MNTDSTTKARMIVTRKKEKGMIRFDVSTTDSILIDKIVDRATKMDLLFTDRLSLEMDLKATHRNGCPLNLAKLLLADDFNFAHDICGIQRHLDRDDNSATAGQLLWCFLPRFSAR